MRPVQLDELLAEPVVVPLVRYYGCMPCRAFLQELEKLRRDFETAGVRIVAVGGAADYQARNLMDNGIDYWLLLDPSHALYEALDVRRIHWWMLLYPRTWWRYLSTIHRARQGRITGHPLQAPGLAIIDTDRTIRFLYRGRTLGDYPSPAAVLSEARRLTRHHR
ncbi:redoxin domain-containing protein [Rhodococcus sp. IEGM 1318]|uniref:redoxin domain-containing protein n=1 Tax=Rhodococcus sp. IEGM 1318 TaxID=3082226 RepID=UPI0029548290|nr:redoxin domain-containing protein [Rhodococcus sp. IEGM 1318]MDV8009184.1 redoxin domain-containing protein [Rhodococcus sp. IEGM 1318]